MTESFFSHIIGHEVQISQLEKMLANASMPHAMIFSGPRGIGKRSCAIACAGELLAASPEKESCRSLISAGTHPDFHTAQREEGKKDIAVETIRELRSALQLKPYLGTAITAIIDDAELMNASAYNALLKTLEEPHPNTFLFLITERLHALPETIRSRCQTLHFSGLSPAELENVLVSLAPKLNEDRKQLSTIVHFCDGSLEQLALSQFAFPRRIGLEPPKGGIEAHILEQVRSFSAAHREVESLIASGNTARALSLASTLTAQKGMEYVFWASLRLALYQRLHSSPSKELAEVLTQALEAEQLAIQRNINHTLLASEALYKAANLRL